MGSHKSIVDGTGNCSEPCRGGRYGAEERAVGYPGGGGEGDVREKTKAAVWPPFELSRFSPERFSGSFQAPSPGSSARNSSCAIISQRIDSSRGSEETSQESCANAL